MSKKQPKKKPRASMVKKPKAVKASERNRAKRNAHVEAFAGSLPSLSHPCFNYIARDRARDLWWKAFQFGRHVQRLSSL